MKIEICFMKIVTIKNYLMLKRGGSFAHGMHRVQEAILSRSLFDNFTALSPCTSEIYLEDCVNFLISLLISSAAAAAAMRLGNLFRDSEQQLQWSKVIE